MADVSMGPGPITSGGFIAPPPGGTELNAMVQASTNPYVSNGGATVSGLLMLAAVATGNVEFVPLAVFLGTQGLTQAAAGSANLIALHGGASAGDLFPNTGIAGTFNGFANAVTDQPLNAGSVYYSATDFTANMLGGIPFVFSGYSTKSTGFFAGDAAEYLALVGTGQAAVDLMAEINAFPAIAPFPMILPSGKKANSAASDKKETITDLPKVQAAQNTETRVEWLPHGRVGRVDARGNVISSGRPIAGATLLVTPDEIANALSGLGFAPDGATQSSVRDIINGNER